MPDKNNPTPDDNSIDFEPGLKPGDFVPESPAENAARMLRLAEKYDLQKAEVEGRLIEREKVVGDLEQSGAGLESQKKIESANSFDELMTVIDSFGESIPSRNAGAISVHNLKLEINKYRSGDTLIYVKDILDNMDSKGGNVSDALKRVTRTFGIRKKVFELIEKEKSGKFIKLDGSIKV